MYLLRQAWAYSVDPEMQNAASYQDLHCLPLIQLFLDTTLGSKSYLFKFYIKNDKDLRCLSTKGKYSKVTDTEIKWSILSKSVTIIIFVKFIDQLIDYPINCATLGQNYIGLFSWCKSYPTSWNSTENFDTYRLADLYRQTWESREQALELYKIWHK